MTQESGADEEECAGYAGWGKRGGIGRVKSEKGGGGFGGNPIVIFLRMCGAKVSGRRFLGGPKERLSGELRQNTYAASKEGIWFFGWKGARERRETKRG